MSIEIVIESYKEHGGRSQPVLMRLWGVTFFAMVIVIRDDNKLLGTAIRFFEKKKKNLWLLKNLSFRRLAVL